MVKKTLDEMITPIRKAYAAMRDSLERMEKEKAEKLKRLEPYKGSAFYDQSVTDLNEEYERQRIASNADVAKAIEMPEQMTAVINVPEIPTADELNIIKAAEYHTLEDLEKKAADYAEQLQSEAARTAFKNVLSNKGMSFAEITTNMKRADPLQFLEEFTKNVFLDTIKRDYTRMEKETSNNLSFIRALSNGRFTDKTINNILSSVVEYPTEKEKKAPSVYGAEAAARFNAKYAPRKAYVESTTPTRNTEISGIGTPISIPGAVNPDVAYVAPKNPTMTNTLPGFTKPDIV